MIILNGRRCRHCRCRRRRCRRRCYLSCFTYQMIVLWTSIFGGDLIPPLD